MIWEYVSKEINIQYHLHRLFITNRDVNFAYDE